MSTVLTLPRIKIETLPLVVHGTSPLVIHHWSDRYAIKPKTTDDEMFGAARIRDIEGRDCVFASYFQHAVVDAAMYFDKITKAVVRGALAVVATSTRVGSHEPDVLPIDYERLERRVDRITFADRHELEYTRPEYHGWKCSLQLRINKDVLTADQVVELFEMAGQRIGVGRRRPQENGQNGTWTVFG